LIVTAQFERDAKRQEKRGKAMERLEAIVELIRTRQPLESKHRDHALGGGWKGWRDCHIEPDWILIYKREHATLTLGRTGSHSDVFGK
jgi:mRNA interferase YafQ